MMVKPESSITPAASITCAGLVPCRNTAASVLAHSEAAQHLAGVIPERRADLREHDVALRHLARGGKLRRHAELRIMHGGGADEMDDVGATLAHIGALDQVAERTFV